MNYECNICHDTGYKQIEPHARIYCSCWRGTQIREQNNAWLNGTTCRACKDTGYYATAPNVFKLCDCRAGQLRRGKTTTAPPLCPVCNNTGLTKQRWSSPHCDCPIGQAKQREIEAQIAAHPVEYLPRHELTADEETALDAAWARALGPGWTVKS